MLKSRTEELMLDDKSDVTRILSQEGPLAWEGAIQEWCDRVTALYNRRQLIYARKAGSWDSDRSTTSTWFGIRTQLINFSGLTCAILA
jgi:hypothetical protein